MITLIISIKGLMETVSLENPRNTIKRMSQSFHTNQEQSVIEMLFHLSNFPIISEFVSNLFPWRIEHELRKDLYNSRFYIGRI